MTAEILLIEDDPDIAENIQEYLTNQSKGLWKLHLADNGAVGAQLYAKIKALSARLNGVKGGNK